MLYHGKFHCSLLSKSPIYFSCQTFQPLAILLLNTFLHTTPRALIPFNCHTLLPVVTPLSRAFLHSTLKVLHSLQLSHICTSEHSTTKCDPAHYSQTPHSLQWPWQCQMHSGIPLSKYAVPFSCHTVLSVSIPEPHIFPHTNLNICSFFPL
jgi:hypothetical protein